MTAFFTTKETGNAYHPRQSNDFQQQLENLEGANQTLVREKDCHATGEKKAKQNISVME